MQLKKRLMYSGIASALALILSIFTPIIPCTVKSKIPNAVSRWTLCTLNPDQINSFGLVKEYFGYTTSLTDSYMLTIVITFIVAMALIHLATRKKKN